MAIDKQQFIDAGRWMTVPRDRLSADLQSADSNNDGAVNSPDEFRKLHDRLAAEDDGQAALVAVAGLMCQANVPNPAELNAHKLKDLPELQSVWHGLGRIVRLRGASAGTRAIQQALNEIAEKLPDYPKCRVGRPDGKFGGKSEAAVHAFQAVHQDLEDSGKVDSATLRQLDAVLARARTVQVNKPEVNNSKPTDADRLRMIGYSDRFGSDCVLTFDDGPDPDTERVLDALAAGGIKGATFFVQGVNAKRYPRILERIVSEGQVLGNHTYDHPDLRKISVQKLERQFRMCQDAVNDALGRDVPMTQMRPPYGALNDRAKSVLRAQNLAVMLWQVDSNDWRAENKRNPSRIVKNVFGGSAPVTGGRGGLILFHDIHPTTGKIVPEIIRQMKAAGLRHTTGERLLKQKYAA